MAQNVKYVIVTPVRDEEKHIEATIDAVAGQTIRPAEWVIVNDGSSDRTGDIVDGCGQVPMDFRRSQIKQRVSKVRQWSDRSIL